jgi:hypothetical protein
LVFTPSYIDKITQSTETAEDIPPANRAMIFFASFEDTEDNFKRIKEKKDKLPGFLESIEENNFIFESNGIISLLQYNDNFVYVNFDYMYDCDDEEVVLFGIYEKTAKYREELTKWLYENYKFKT